MKKISKFDRKRGILPDKIPSVLKSKLPPMTEKAFLIYTKTELLPDLANLIAEYASPSYREIVDHFCNKAETTVGDMVCINNKVSCDKNRVDFMKHKGRKPGKKEFYVNPKIEFCIFNHVDTGGSRTFFITKEYFITSLETKVWFLPDNTKIKIEEKFYKAILTWLDGILPFQ